MGVRLAGLLLGWLATATALHVEQERPDGSLAYDDTRGLGPGHLEILSRDSADQWGGDHGLSRDPADHWYGAGYTFGAELTGLLPQRRAKRRVKHGDGHVISSFKRIPDKALNVATRIVSDISARDCAVYCIHTGCKAWSRSNVTSECRLLRAKTDYVAVPVVLPGSDYYEISPKRLGGALFTILTTGAASHAINIQPSQIRVLHDPLAPENVLTDFFEPLPTTPEPTDPPTLPPGTNPPATDPPPTSPPVPSLPTPTDPPTSTDLSYHFDFPLECGTRPSFGLRDNVRLLQPAGIEQVKVVGGAPVATGTYPWQAQLEVANKRGYEHSCGGIVISPELILTAAHCHNKHESSYQVRVAQNNILGDDPSEQIIAVENIYRHSGYRPDIQQGQKNDIAMMKLKFRRGAPQALSFNVYVQPLCLPTRNTTLRVGQDCQISGWGLVDANHPKTADYVSPLLRGAVISVLDPALCYKAYGNRFDERLMICAGRPEGGVDTCQGDSGGPLSCRDHTGQWFTAGIVSFGWECGARGHPGVYTRVSAYLEFVHRTAAFLTGVSVV